MTINPIYPHSLIRLPSKGGPATQMIILIMLDENFNDGWGLWNQSKNLINWAQKDPVCILMMMLMKLIMIIAMMMIIMVIGIMMMMIMIIITMLILMMMTTRLVRIEQQHISALPLLEPSRFASQDSLRFFPVIFSHIFSSLSSKSLTMAIATIIMMIKVVPVTHCIDFRHCNCYHLISSLYLSS